MMVRMVKTPGRLIQRSCVQYDFEPPARTRFDEEHAASFIFTANYRDRTGGRPGLPAGGGWRFGTQMRCQRGTRKRGKSTDQQ
jgi:hypothetical protein